MLQFKWFSLMIFQVHGTYREQQEELFPTARKVPSSLLSTELGESLLIDLNEDGKQLKNSLVASGAWMGGIILIIQTLKSVIHNFSHPEPDSLHLRRGVSAPGMFELI